MTENRPPRFVLGAAALALAALPLAPAGADWLVTRDGGRVETQGPWEERGRLIVFTRPGGELASLRATEVDLDASRTATEEAARMPEEAVTQPEKPKKKAPVLVLTDDDVDHLDPAALDEGGEADEPEVVAPDGLEITTWRQGESPSGNIELRGTVRNASTQPATDITIMVTLFDDQGGEVGARQAVLTTRSLGPSELLNFRAEFPDVFSFSRPRFEIETRSFEPRDEALGAGGFEDSEAPGR